MWETEAADQKIDGLCLSVRGMRRRTQQDRHRHLQDVQRSAVQLVQTVDQIEGHLVGGTASVRCV